jgi:hypothetical protein
MSFLSKASFWTHEATAPLLLQNHAFFGNGAPVSAATVARFEAWAAAMGVAGDRSEYEALVRQLDLANPRFPEIARVIERDVVRTFFHDDCRVPLSHFLHVCANEFQDYHQGLGYIARCVRVRMRVRARCLTPPTAFFSWCSTSRRCWPCAAR